MSWMHRRRVATTPGGVRQRTAPALLVVSMLAAASLFVGCKSEQKKAELPKPALESDRIVFPKDSPQLVSITTEPVRPSGPNIVRLNGRLVWNEERTARLFPAFAGRVTQILAKPGDTVRAGQSLALLASPDFGLAQSEARKSASDFALAEKNLSRARDLVAAGVAPRKDLNAAEADYARGEAELARTRARLKLYGGADVIDQNFALRSPIAGVIVERNVNPGQELRPDLATTNAPAMFVITDPARLWVQIDATERELAYLKAGRSIKCQVGAYPDERFDARIDVVSDFIDPVTRTIKARGSIDNPSRRLKGEMFVNAVIEGESRASMDVPARAVFLDGDEQYVFVEEATGRFARVPVKTEGEPNGHIGIVSGVSIGQKVVVDGSLLLQRLYHQLAKR